MRTRKAVITMALAAAALAAQAAPALAAPVTVAAHTLFVGHYVGGGIVTGQPLAVGQVIYSIGSTQRARSSSYRVTAEHRYGEAYYVTLSPRLPVPDNEGVLFTT